MSNIYHISFCEIIKGFDSIIDVWQCPKYTSGQNFVLERYKQTGGQDVLFWNSNNIEEQLNGLH